MARSGPDLRKALDAKRPALAAAMVERYYRLHPAVREPGTSERHAKSLRDADYHVRYLIEAVVASEPSLFLDYVGWLQTLFAERGFPDSTLQAVLQCLRSLLREMLPVAVAQPAGAIVDAALEHLAAGIPLPEPFIDDDAPLGTLAREYLEALLRGERHAARQLILDALQSGAAVEDLYLHVFQAALREVGRLWQLNRISVAQEHYLTAATQLLMGQFYDSVFDTERIGRRMVATCVSDELHEIGLRMVADFFELAGWDTYYLGASTPASSVVREVVKRDAEVLAISATMTFHIPLVSDLIERVRASVTARPVTILVGGYPFNVSPALWREVGADGCGADAQEAIQVANRLSPMDASDRLHGAMGLALRCDAQGRIVRLIRDDLGLQQQAAIGRPFPLLVHNGDAARGLAFLEAIQHDGTALDWELKVLIGAQVTTLHFAGAMVEQERLVVAARTRQGVMDLYEEAVRLDNARSSTVPTRVEEQQEVLRPVTSKDGAFIDDLSRLNNELVNLQRELAKKNVELARLNDEKDRFLGVATHELRGPLTLIMGLAEYLSVYATENLGEEEAEFLSVILKSSRYMRALLDDLLDIAKIESGRLDLKAVPVNFAELVGHVVALNSLLAAQKGIEIHWEPEDVGLVVVDGPKFGQVLNNLITNAIKFSFPGSRIEVRLGRSEGAVLISVADQGQGIPPEELDRVFRPFGNISVEATGGEPSTGLGLAIARRIVVGHGGDIWVESQVGRGSTFYVRLPA